MLRRRTFFFRLLLIAHAALIGYRLGRIAGRAKRGNRFPLMSRSRNAFILLIAANRADVIRRAAGHAFYIIAVGMRVFPFVVSVRSNGLALLRAAAKP